MLLLKMTLALTAIRCCLAGDLAIKVSETIEKTLNFIRNNLEIMNLDAILGVTLGDALLQAIDTSRLSPEVALTIEGFKSNSEYIRKNWNFHGVRYNYKRFFETLFSVDGWKRNYTYKHVKLGKRKNVTQLEDFIRYLSSSPYDGSRTDNCLSELISSRSLSRFCRVSVDCESYMISGKLGSGYYVSHRLFFLQLLRYLGCAYDAIWFENKTNEYCAYMLDDGKTNASLGFSAIFDDILLEYITLCGMEGYRDFFSPEWLNHMFDIQSASGCFGENVAAYRHDYQPREINQIGSGCTDHSTGLAFSALAANLRFLLETSETKR